jgi:putative ABC transport system permease protein
MNWLETFRTGGEAILSHRLRSALTMLGILIGIAAVILTVGLGEGASSKVNAAIQALGSNLLTVTPGSSTTGGVRGGFGSASSLTTLDADALANKKDCPDVAAVAPSSSLSTVLVAGSSNWTTTAVGSSPGWLAVHGRQMLEGSFFTSADVSQANPVVVLGPTTAEELYGFSDPVGQSLTIGGESFTVDGVLTSIGSSTSSTTTSNPDDQAVVPITTFQQRLTGGFSRNSVASIVIEATNKNTLSAAYQEVNDELLNVMGVTDPLLAPFTITTQTQVLSTATSVDHTLTILLAGIAAISLLVGGIGVMNIMLVSVTERVREIGLRKALGATPAVIRRQFLVEATVLGLVGGVIGVLLGLGGAIGLPHVISNPIVISPTAAVAAIAVSLGIGLGFGVYPATRAARLAPIDALRSE